MTATDIAFSGRRLAGVLRGIARHRVAAAVAVLLVLPWLVPYSALAVNILLYGLFALGFNLLFGYTGLLSFGHAAFFGLGAYGLGIGVVHFGLGWLPAIALGVVVATLGAMLMGAMAIRSRGIYFSMVTLALAQCIYYIVYHMESWSGGENGLRGVDVGMIALPGFQIDLIDPLQKYYFILAFVVAALWLLSRILASPFGGVLEAVRENERRARACGFDVGLTKWVAFVISGAYCGLAGALMALHLSIVPIDLLHYQTSGLVVMMSLLGGMGTFFGPFAGAALFLLIEDVGSLVTVHWQFIAGAMFMIFVLFFPRGVWGSFLHWLSK